MSANQLALWYLVAAVSFILALKGLTVDTTVEFGGNKVLTGMVKRIDKELASIALDSPADLEAFGKSL